jgi:hypothetical protein
METNYSILKHDMQEAAGPQIDAYVKAAKAFNVFDKEMDRKYPKRWRPDSNKTDTQDTYKLKAMSPDERRQYNDLNSGKHTARTSLTEAITPVLERHGANMTGDPKDGAFGDLVVAQFFMELDKRAEPAHDPRPHGPNRAQLQVEGAAAVESVVAEVVDEINASMARTFRSYFARESTKKLDKRAEPAHDPRSPGTESTKPQGHSRRSPGTESSNLPTPS